MQTIVKDRQLDILFIHPPAAEEMFQELADKFSAIEPPTWCLLLANAVINCGFGAAILDCEQERLGIANTVQRIKDYNPRLICIVAFGSQPNASTFLIGNSLKIAKDIKNSYGNQYKVCLGGTHVNAIPDDVLRFDYVDFALLNEGTNTLIDLLATDLSTDLHTVKGLGWKEENGSYRLNECNNLVNSAEMDHRMPGSAWHLLPYKNKPLDLTRSHYWHAGYNDENRSPFASLYTSLGCQFRCDFCMINSLNRTNTDLSHNAANFNVMRFWSPEFIIKEIDKLVEYGVRTLRIADELFLFNRKYYEPLLKLIIERGYGDILSMWSYSRIDTIREEYLELLQKAGMKFIAVGIEAANQKIRKEITKGRFTEINVREIIKKTRDAGINIIQNFIVGLPEETLETMEESYQLAAELNCEAFNIYPCFALPGSPLYTRYRKENPSVLPTEYDEWTFLGYKSKPLPTRYLTAADVLKFRDESWHRYHSRPIYLNMIESKFGLKQRQNIEEMSKIRLRRKLLED